ncbi:MAG: hypothetical protein JSU77_00715 [Fidelibacterota bacterium]|nr:MAG: hypothetical protein JSU77_00715 [Candidatus Neomarinimicrobiota bacterium]
MGLSKNERYLIVGFLGVLLLAVPASAQSTPETTDFKYLAQEMAADVTFGPLPRGDFSPISVTIFPAHYQPTGKNRHFLPLMGLQWWVSPNLAFLGGLGAGITDQLVVQYARIGLCYLPSSLSIGSFTPEFYFTQNNMEGLSRFIDHTILDSLGNEIEVSPTPDRYDSGWNEIGWGYTGQVGAYCLSGAVIFLFQKTFIGSGQKLRLNSKLIRLSIGRDIFGWLRVSIQAKANPDFITGGVQLSLAI